MKKLKQKILMGLLAVSALMTVKAQTWICGTQPTTVNSTQSLPSGCTYNSAAYNSKYALQSFYVPTANTPLIKVKYALHIFDNTTQSTTMYKNNATDSARFAYINNVVQGYSRYSDPRQGHNAINPTYIYDSRVEYECTGIYFYYDNAMYLNCNFNSLHAYVKGIDSTRLESLPIFFTNGDIQTCVGVPAVGYAYLPSLGNLPTGVVTALHGGHGDYFASEHIRHEIGHTMGWLHMYNSEALNCTDSDFLSDVFPSNNPYCGSSSQSTCGACYEVGCNNVFTPTSNFSNNVMSGCSNNWMSPLQMGRRRRTLSLYNTRQYVKDMISDHINVTNITTNETWDFDIQMYEDIVVKAGNTLNVKCKIAMAKEGRIIVENGAKIVIDGGEITTWSKTGPWAGIFVSGTSNTYQSTIDAGVFDIINNGTLSNADVAVNTFTIDSNNNIDWNSTGGILYGNNGNFINNRKDVQFMYYHQPGGFNNLSYFKNCNFKTNAPLLAGANYDSRVSLYEVDGIKFNGCNFENTSGSLPNLSGYGINSIDASYLIDKNGSVQTQFVGFKDGVHVDNTNPLRVVSVKNTNFYDNYYNSTYYNTITTPIFEDNYVRTASEGTGTGLYLYNCKNYTVKNNSFLQNTALINGGDLGIYAYNSQAGAHKIYRNNFANFTAGIVADSDNSGTTNSSDGLLMNCNDFTAIANAYDIALVGNAPTVAQTQGAIGSAQTLVRNKYAATSGCGNCENEWYIQSYSAKVGGYLHAANSDANTRPVPQPQLSDVDVNVINSGISLSYNLHCPASTTSGGGCPCAGCCRLAEINSGLSAAIVETNSIVANYNNLLDGGNTQNLLNAIYGNTNKSALKDMLYTKAFLSDTVLKAYIANTGVSNSDIKDVLQNNVPATADVWQTVLNRNFNTTGMTDLNTQQTSQKVSSRRSAEALVSLAKFNLQELASQKLNYFLTDTLPSSKDSVMQLLSTNVGNLPDANMLLVYAHLNKGDISKATKIISDLQNTQPDLADYLNVLMRTQTSPNRAFSLLNNPQDVNFLTKYASNSDNIGYGGAQALLKFVKGINYTLPRLYPIQNDNGGRLLNNQKNNNFNLNTLETNIKLFPNPTTGLLNLSVNLQNGDNRCDYSVNVSDVIGKVVYKTTIKNKEEIQLLLNHLNSGLYILSVSNGTSIIYQTKVAKLN